MAESRVHEAAWFAGDWLAKREDADHAARNIDLTRRLAQWVQSRFGNNGKYHVLDLGCGTGSNVRYLAPRLPHSQSWLLIDQDADHLAAAEHLCTDLPGVTMLATRCQGIEVDIQAAIPDHSEVVTGSALLDLVSEAWMDQLAARVCELSAAALFSLSYSGDFRMTPGLEDDELVRQAVNDHQRSEKMSGRALGPDAWLRCAQQFESHGYHVYSAPSPWQLTSRDHDLQVQLFEGWAKAAAEQQPQHSVPIKAWLARRIDILEHHDSETVVFHQDVLALPGLLSRADIPQTP